MRSFGGVLDFFGGDGGQDLKKGKTDFFLIETHETGGGQFLYFQKHQRDRIQTTHAASRQRKKYGVIVCVYERMEIHAAKATPVAELLTGNACSVYKSLCFASGKQQARVRERTGKAERLPHYITSQQPITVII